MVVPFLAEKVYGGQYHNESQEEEMPITKNPPKPAVEDTPVPKLVPKPVYDHNKECSDLNDSNIAPTERALFSIFFAIGLTTASCFSDTFEIGSVLLNKLSDFFSGTSVSEQDTVQNREPGIHYDIDHRKPSQLEKGSPLTDRRPPEIETVRSPSDRPIDERPSLLGPGSANLREKEVPEQKSESLLSKTEPLNDSNIAPTERTLFSIFFAIGLTTASCCSDTFEIGSVLLNKLSDFCSERS
jgi:hypothetical protein